MKFSFHLPVDKVSLPEEFLTQAAITEIAQAIERAKFDACFVTDHPAPLTAWVEGGGHHALDPFVALAFAAAATTALKLHTNVLVAPYRNPLLMAKSVASLDRLSNGRVILGVGSGYLYPEFEALGMPFVERGEATDEAIRVMKEIWTGRTIDHDSPRFRAHGVSALPVPVQCPHPPIWSGGNSDRAIRRAVELCDGWSPFPISEQASGHVRTGALSSMEALKKKLVYVEELAERAQRSKPLEICMVPFSLGLQIGSRPERSAMIDELGLMASMGVDWTPISLPCRSRQECIAQAQWFSEEVMPAIRGR